MLAISCGADDGVISLLVGEMAGRPEGGAKDRDVGDWLSPSVTNPRG
ncbi:hypothetical protein CO731_02729 [Aminobacter sp. MSH1]|nr:hypothetical protein CO731_02729 [Aminobacter sp. MSH1]